MDVKQMPVKVNFSAKLSNNNNNNNKNNNNSNNNKIDTKSFLLILLIEGVAVALIKNVICCVFYLFKELIARSPWKTCEGSDGNLCRCQARPCQDRLNSSCQGGYELRFENCTGLLGIFLLLPCVFSIFLFFLGIIVPFCRKITAEHRH